MSRHLHNDIFRRLAKVICPDFDIRYYMGRHKIQIVGRLGKKYYIEHKEEGKVGNAKCGYKEVKEGDSDIVPMWLCWHNKREGEK